MSVKLYGMAGSPNVRGAMLGLAEKGVDYNMISVLPPFKDAEHLVLLSHKKGEDSRICES